MKQHGCKVGDGNNFLGKRRNDTRRKGIAWKIMTQFRRGDSRHHTLAVMFRINLVLRVLALPGRNGLFGGGANSWSWTDF